ncbi:MAG: hypothetical protein A4E65_03564 [Syntrophorhabdus sp. PtaU1.Bin153]|nr:MAG: hypothetical protein A4E65_03564 [Syntrophorhabdus sp. PtaU1.Bin153]
MRLFVLLDTQHLILGIFLGLICAILIYLGFRSARFVKPRKGEGRESGYPDGLEIEDHPFPPLLVFLILGFVVWLIFYVIFFGLKRGPL